MEMSKQQKMLKVLCILGIIMNAIAAILALSAAAVSIIGLSAPGVDLSSAVNGTINGQTMSTGQVLGTLGVFGVIAGILYVFNVVACILGLRGANNPSKIKPFFNLVVILTVLQVIAIAFNVLSGGVSSNMFLSFFFDVILIGLASQIMKQA